MRIQTDGQNLWNKKGTFVGQNNRPRSYDILNKRGNVLPKNRRHLILATRRFNIKHDSDNFTPISYLSNHPNLMNYDQHDKPTCENVYRTKCERIVKMPKGYIDEMSYNLFSISRRKINKPSDILKKCDIYLTKRYIEEMWFNLF